MSIAPSRRKTGHEVLGMCTLLFCVMTGEACATLIIVAVPAVVGPATMLFQL
jgi:hypothetical protein